MKCIHRVNEMTTNKNWDKTTKICIDLFYMPLVIALYLRISPYSQQARECTRKPICQMWVKKTSMQRKKIVNVFIPDDSTILHIQTTLNYSPKSFHICGHCSCMRATFATSFNSPFIYYAPFGMCFSSIRFVCLINVKHFQNNGYNEYKYNEWSRKCGFSVLATA